MSVINISRNPNLWSPLGRMLILYLITSHESKAPVNPISSFHKWGMWTFPGGQSQQVVQPELEPWPWVPKPSCWEAWLPNTQLVEPAALGAALPGLLWFLRQPATHPNPFPLPSLFGNPLPHVSPAFRPQSVLHLHGNCSPGLLSSLCALLCTVGLAPFPHLPLLPMAPSAPTPFWGTFRTKTHGLRNLQTFLLNLRPQVPVGRLCCFAAAPTWQPTRSHPPRNYVAVESFLCGPTWSPCTMCVSCNGIQSLLHNWQWYKRQRKTLSYSLFTIWLETSFPSTYISFLIKQ